MAKPLDLQSDLDKATTSFEALLTPEEEQTEASEEELQVADETVEEEITEEEELVEEHASDLEDDENEEAEITLDDEQVEIEEVEEPTLYAVKINGVEEMVTLDELQSSFSRQKDYTKKTQELAAQRRQLKNMQAEISQKDEVYSELLPKMQSALENSLGQEPNWQELYDNDPISYVREKDVWEEKKKQLEAVQAEQARVQQEAQAKQAEQIQKYMQYGESKLLDQIPSWKDSQKATNEKMAIRDHAFNDLGFTAEEIEQVYDYRLLLGLRNSWLQSKTQKAVKKNPKQKKAAARVARPGSVTQKNKTTPLKKSRQKLRKTGKVQDAAKVFEQMLS